jgi:FAD binding domain-containing protein
MLVMPDSSRTVGSDLRRLLREDQIKDDPPTKTAYAVDASIYRMDPQAVALVESEEDIHRLLRYAVERGIPLTARAAGTNLTGSAACIVFSKSTQRNAGRACSRVSCWRNSTSNSPGRG